MDSIEIVVYCQSPPVSLSFPGNFSPFISTFLNRRRVLLRRLARNVGHRGHRIGAGLGISDGFTGQWGTGRRGAG